MNSKNPNEYQTRQFGLAAFHRLCLGDDSHLSTATDFRHKTLSYCSEQRTIRLFSSLLSLPWCFVQGIFCSLEDPV